MLGIIPAIMSFLSSLLAKIGINILNSPAKTTEVKHHDANISIKPDESGALDRLRRLR